MGDVEILYRLQLVDSEHLEVARQLRLMKEALGESAELRSARQQMEREERKLSDCRRKLRNLELELEGLSAKIERTADRLYSGEVRNPKELTSLQQDLDYLQRRRERLEDQVLEALTEMDEHEAQAAEAQALFKQVKTQWEQEQRDLERAVVKAERRKEELEEEAKALRAAAAPDALELYDELFKKKNGRAVVLIEGGLCQGCRVSVPSGLVQQARHGELVTCVSCGRILYIKH